MTLAQQAIMEVAQKFPSAATKTIARMVYRDNPTLFTNLEACRMAVKRMRNGPGAHKQYLPRTTKTVAIWDKIEEGKTQFDHWGAIKVPGKRVLVLTDIHLPYHDKSALDAALAYGKNNNADTIILDGDCMDFFSVSFWEKDPRQRNLAAELKTGVEFLAYLRAQFPKAHIVFKDGNHEERWERYMRVKAPELLGIEDFEMKKLLRLREQGISHVGEKRPLKVGELNVIHGHEYRFAISNPVNPARGLFLRAKAYAVCGHFHQSSYHTERTIEQNVVATWSTGCLCDLHPEYAVMNNWVHGFAFVEVSSDGKFNMQHKVIRNGKVY